MSYWIYLEDRDGNAADVAAHEEGGTFAMGGMPQAELNVTYNYSDIFSIKKELDGKTAAETLPLLKQKVAEFGVERDNDYWKSTEGNVGYMLEILRRWAEQYPDYKWRVN